MLVEHLRKTGDTFAKSTRANGSTLQHIDRALRDQLEPALRESAQAIFLCAANLLRTNVFLGREKTEQKKKDSDPSLFLLLAHFLPLDVRQ